MVKCSTCGSKNIIPIIYGHPKPSAIEDEKKGRLIIGGCESGNETHHCKDCKNEFKVKKR